MSEMRWVLDADSDAVYLNAHDVAGMFRGAVAASDLGDETIRRVAHWVEHVAQYFDDVAITTVIDVREFNRGSPLPS